MNSEALLIITTSYPQRGDGSEAAGAFVADFAETLSELCPVRVVAPGVTNGTIQQQSGVEVRRFAAPGRPLSLLSPARPTDWLGIIATLRSLRSQVLDAASDGRVSHTLALWALPSGWAAAALKRKHGVPYSIWALGSDIWQLGRLPVVRSVLRSVARDASVRYADGIGLANDAEEICGVPFEFLPSTRRLGGARTREISLGPPYRLVFLGRWHPNKGVDLLLEGLLKLSDADWRLINEVHVAGGGPLERLVCDQVALLRSMGRPVRLSGYLDRGQAVDAFNDADFLLLPSRIESIPVIFSDALKMKLPVISMPVGDMPQLVSESGGFLAKSVSAEAFSEALVCALNSPPVGISLGLERVAEIFSLEAVARKIVDRSRKTGAV